MLQDRYQSSPNVNTLKYYPIVGRQNPTLIDQNQFNNMKIRQISFDSMKIARQYLKNGLRQPNQEQIRRQKLYYENKYRLHQRYVKELKEQQLSFCIVIPSYNNADNMRYKFPLNSVFRQDYSNYHVVYIDDASTDNTKDLVLKYIKLRKIPSSKFKMISNQYNKLALKNLYEAALYHCGQDQIMIILDGDDGLVGTQVLKLFNLHYQTSNDWFIYSNYIHSVKHQWLGISQRVDKQVLQKKQYRDYAWKRWITSKETTFYNKLFQITPKQNFYELNPQTGQEVYFKGSYDRAIIYPIIQMAGTKVKYLSQVLYIYVQSTDYSDGKVHGKDQERAMIQITSYPKSKQLECLFYSNNSDKVCQSPVEYILNKNRNKNDKNNSKNYKGKHLI